MIGSADAASRGALRVRLAAGADLPLLARFERAAFTAPWPEEEIATLLGSGAVIAYLAERSDGTAVAYALFQLLPDECELLRVGVPSALRRSGLALRLLQQALDQLAAAGRGVCHLEVRAGNLPAQRLYERLGFELAGRRSRYYADGEDALRYVRRHPRSGG